VVDANTGKQVWSLWLGDPLTSAPAIADGRVYTSYPAGGHPSASHVLAAFDLQTGKILWQRWIDSDVQSAPVVAEGKVHASTFGGSVYQLDPKTGEFLSGASPAPPRLPPSPAATSTTARAPTRPAAVPRKPWRPERGRPSACFRKRKRSISTRKSSRKPPTPSRPNRSTR
jgi:hypothetical protein